MMSGLFLFISFVCAYLYVNWLPIPDTISFINIIMEQVLNPIMFFAAAITFIIGFITNGIFIRMIVYLIKQRNKNNAVFFSLIINLSFFIFIYIFLMKLAFWQIVLFFSFAFLYGMMTYEKNK
jgi:hypothetical protein